MSIIGTLKALDDTRGAVRLEEVYDTDIADLWDACTQPERLARWVADVSGDLRPGGEFAASFTSGWQGTGHIEVCEAPHRLQVSTRETGQAAGESTEQVIEVTLTADGDRTVLVVEERGLPVDHLAAYGAGWHLHVEDLGGHLAGRERDEDNKARWDALIPLYRDAPVEPVDAATM